MIKDRETSWLFFTLFSWLVLARSFGLFGFPSLSVLFLYLSTISTYIIQTLVSVTCPFPCPEFGQVVHLSVHRNVSPSLPLSTDVSIPLSVHQNFRLSIFLSLFEFWPGGALNIEFWIRFLSRFVTRHLPLLNSTNKWKIVPRASMIRSLEERRNTRVGDV